MFPKNIRIQDSKYVKQLKFHPCCICGGTEPEITIDPSHIKTRGSGGGDEEWNVVPMCRKHHTEWHMVGANKFTQMYPKMNKLLKKLGWKWLPNGRLFHEKGGERK